MIDPYHTALRQGHDPHKDVDSSDLHLLANGVIFRHDIISDGPPLRMKDCDVLYADPPWPHGFKVFNERAGFHHKSYDQLAEAITDIITSLDKLTIMAIGKTLLRKLPEPYQLKSINLNGSPALLGVWNGEVDSYAVTTKSFCEYLGSRFECMGDFTCGYGASVRSFLAGGGTGYVASDFDGKCVTVMADIMRQHD